MPCSFPCPPFDAVTPLLTHPLIFSSPLSSLFIFPAEHCPIILVCVSSGPGLSVLENVYSVLISTCNKELVCSYKYKLPFPLVLNLTNCGMSQRYTERHGGKGEQSRYCLYHLTSCVALCHFKFLEGRIHLLLTLIFHIVP